MKTLIYSLIGFVLLMGCGTEEIITTIDQPTLKEIMAESDVSIRLTLEGNAHMMYQLFDGDTIKGTAAAGVVDTNRIETIYGLTDFSFFAWSIDRTKSLGLHIYADDSLIWTATSDSVGVVFPID